MLYFESSLQLKKQEQEFSLSLIVLFNFQFCFLFVGLSLSILVDIPNFMTSKFVLIQLQNHFFQLIDPYLFDKQKDICFLFFFFIFLFLFNYMVVTFLFSFLLQKKKWDVYTLFFFYSLNYLVVRTVTNIVLKHKMTITQVINSHKFLVRLKVIIYFFMCI